MAFDPDAYLAQDFDPDAYLGSAEEVEQPDYTERVSQQFKESSGNIVNILMDAHKRNQEARTDENRNPFQEDLEAAYDTLAIGGEIAEAGFSLFGEAYKEIPENVRKKAENVFGKSAESLYNLLNIGGGLDVASEKIGSVAEEVAELAKENPKQAAAVEDALQIAGMTKAAQAAVALGGKTTLHKWVSVVTPAATTDELKRRALNSKTTLLSAGTTDVPVTVQWQKDMIKTLKNVKGVHPANRNQVNLNAVINAIPDRAKKLESKLVKSKVKINPDEVNERLMETLYKSFNNDPIFDGYSDKELDRVLTRSMRFINESGGTPNGLWNARKKLDAFYEFHKGERFVSGSTNASQASEAYRIARNTLNDVLEENVKGSRAALKDMHIMYNARDILVDKAILDDPTLAGRMIDKVRNVVDIRAPVVRGGYYQPQSLAR